MSKPDVRRGTIAWSNREGVQAAVYAAASAEAQASLSDGEKVYELQVEPGTAQRGNNAMMDYPYSYLVVRPGGQARRR